MEEDDAESEDTEDEGTSESWKSEWKGKPQGRGEAGYVAGKRYSSSE
jgi:hypothetical protein